MEASIQLFIKFSSKKNLEELQNGSVHMGNRSIYSNFKNKNDDEKQKGIRNEDESTLFKMGNFRLVDDENTLCNPIFCLFLLEVEEKLSSRTAIKFADEQRDKLLTAFGDYALIINKEKFTENFIRNAQTNKLITKHNIVSYSNSNFLKNYTEKVLNSGILESGETTILPIDRDVLDNTFFEQPKVHDYQSEYRFIFTNTESKGYSKFKIDSIKNYSKLIKVSDLLDRKTIDLSGVL